MQDYTEQCKRVNDYVNSLSDEEINNMNEKKMKKDQEDFSNLKKELANGRCYYCNNPLTHFSDKKPCLHWLLKPKGFKKRHFPLLFALKSFHEINAYLRWVANTETIVRNINDLNVEKSPSKIIEETIRYKNFEWSFSCSKVDRAGHPHKHAGKNPHYHFEMKIDGLVMINFNGFHIDFHPYDEYIFAIKNGEISRASFEPFQGSGMQHFFDSMGDEELLENMQSSNNDESKAEFKLDTFIQAEEGFKMSGDDIANMIEESRRTGVSIAKLARKLKNVQIQTIVTPGPVIPEISKRHSR